MTTYRTYTREDGFQMVTSEASLRRCKGIEHRSGLKRPGGGLDADGLRWREGYEMPIPMGKYGTSSEILIEDGGITYHIIERHWRKVKDRANRKGIEFSIEVSDLVNAWPVDSECPALGIGLAYGGGDIGRDTSPSVDRIDNTIGYTPDNIQIVSFKANRMKTNATQDELVGFAKWVLNQ